MAERITKKVLYDRVQRLQEMGIDIACHYAYGRPRMTTKAQNVDLSPRLSTREMYEWLNGFEAGLLTATRPMTLVQCSLTLHKRSRLR